MLSAEIALLKAVRDRIRTALVLPDKFCNVDTSGLIPVLPKPYYVTINAAGMQPGSSAQNGTGWDVLFSTRVAVYVEVPHVAQDKRRELFLDLSGRMADKLDQIITIIDADQTVRTLAQGYLVGTRAAGGKFPSTFRTFNIDIEPRGVDANEIGASMPPTAPGADPLLAMTRGVVFQGMRFLRPRG